MQYRLLADATVVVHLLFVTYVVIGGFLAWRWRRTIVAHVPGLTPIELFASSFAITLGLAAASWHALERPALALKARFRDGVGGRLRAGEATP